MDDLEEKFQAGKRNVLSLCIRQKKGNYTLRIDNLTKDNCDHNYSSEKHYATYFAKGYTKYTCSECGDTYKANYSNKSVLATGYISRYGTTGKNYVRISRTSVPRTVANPRESSDSCANTGGLAARS